MQPSKTIAGEIDRLEARRGQIDADAEKARAELDAQRAALVDGAADAAAVTAAQASFTALSEALNTLDGRLAERRQALAEAQQQEEKARRRERVAAIQQERAEAAATYNAARRQAAESLRAPVRVMLDSAARFHQLGGEAIALLQADGPVGNPELVSVTTSRLPVAEVDASLAPYVAGVHTTAEAVAAELDRQQRKERSRLMSERQQAREAAAAHAAVSGR